MVSSSMPGEGKTTILGNLAVTLAQAGHRTLMVDGDLRLGGLSTLFNFNAGAVFGLSEVLTGQIPIEVGLHRTTIERLEILPVGGKAPNPAELVGSETMKRLLLRLKASYDFVLVDTPPITAVADALLVSRLVDSVVFVVRAGVTKRAEARQALEKLVSVKARVIGTVLNSCQGHEDRGFGAGYGVGYGVY
jgi:capsular exopolysaccharide synthesis family protein